MATDSAKISVLAGKLFACIKISGRANFTSGVDFRTLVSELSRRGYTYFLLDLSECTLMDSTFLGVLAGFGLKMGAPQPGLCPPIELLNPNPRITELLDSLGIIHLFKVTHGQLALPEATEPQPHDPAAPTREETTQACLEAHQTLMEIHPGNVRRFKDVAQFLAEDLKRLQAET